MQIFENYDGKSFKLNSRLYVKNFIVNKVGEDHIQVLNAYDSKLQLLPSTHYSQVMVNDATFQNQESLMATLAPMLFTKIIYSDSILPNQLISIPEIVRAQNLLTIAAGGVWRIDGIVVGNSQPFQTVIAYEDAGMNRIDIIVAKSDGTFEKIVGDSSETTASAPLVPSNSLFVTSVNIFGAEIIEGENPIIGTEFIKKAHEGFFHVLALDNAQNGAVTLQFSPDGANKFKIWNATAIRGFAYATNSEAQVNGWGGKSYYLTNETTQPITLKNNVSGIIGFIFPSGQDMILPPKATVEFVYDSKMRYVGVEHIAPVIQTLETVTENGYTTSKPLISYAGENGGIRAQSTDGLKSASIGADSTSGIVTIAKNFNAKGTIKANNLTTQRNLELPNASGTFALTSDVVNSISNIDFQVNQSSAILSLTNSTGQEITSIDLSFLNNEGTTFFYNSDSEKLELKNDAGEVLSELPISSFVSNFAKSLSLNNSILSLRDNSGNILNSVEINTSNVDGLNAELDTKVDKITGYALSKNDLTDALKLAYDSGLLQITANISAINNHIGNTANPHGVTKVQVGLGNVDNTSDVNKPISNAQALANTSKANINGSNTIGGAWSISSMSSPIVDGLQVINTNQDVIYWGNPLLGTNYFEGSTINSFKVNVPNLGVANIWHGHNFNPDSKANLNGLNTTGGAWKIDNISSPLVQAATNNGQIFSASGSEIYWGNPTITFNTIEMLNSNSLRVYTPANGYSQVWHGHNFNPDLKANDSNVLHKTGNEAKSGTLTLNNQINGNAFTVKLPNGSDVAEINTFTAPANINGIVAGHDYKWYDNAWALGIKRGDSDNQLGFGFNLNGVERAVIQENLLRMNGLFSSENEIMDQTMFFGVRPDDGIAYIQGSNYLGDTPKSISIQTFGGNVGIGLSDPTAKLSVNGDIKAFGQVRTTNGFIVESNANSAITLAKADGTPVFFNGTAQSGLAEDNLDGISYMYFGKYRIYTSAIERFVFDNENISRMPLKVEGQVKTDSDFFVQNASGFSRLTPGDVTLKFASGDEFYASPNGIARTYGSTFDLYNLNFPETSTDAIVNLPNRAGTIALLEDVSENYQPIIENTDWINLAHNLPSSYNNVIFRYKIKNGNYILDFYSECLATSVVGNADSFQIGIVENADGEFLRSYNLGDWMVDIGSSITNLKLKSLGGDNDPITLVGNLRDTSIDKISFRATLPITRN